MACSTVFSNGLTMSPEYSVVDHAKITPSSHMDSQNPPRWPDGSCRRNPAAVSFSAIESARSPHVSSRAFMCAADCSIRSRVYGKSVVAIAAGGAYSLALCADGTVAAWGENGWGQLGHGDLIDPHRMPVMVNAASNVSALYGKTVVAIAAGYAHS